MILLEPFKQVLNQPDYLVGHDGNVWTKLARARDGRVLPGRYSDEWTQVHGHIQSEGYIYISLPGGKRLAHHIVLEAFVRPHPWGEQARHLDGVRTHNWLSNLAWGTQLENEADKILHGTLLFGENTPSSKLSNSQTQQIRVLYEAGVKQVELAELFAVSQSNISRILSGKIRSKV